MRIPRIIITAMLTLFVVYADSASAQALPKGSRSTYLVCDVRGTVIAWMPPLMDRTQQMRYQARVAVHETPKGTLIRVEEPDALSGIEVATNLALLNGLEATILDKSTSARWFIANAWGTSNLNIDGSTSIDIDRVSGTIAIEHATGSFAVSYDQQGRQQRKRSSKMSKSLRGTCEKTTDNATKRKF